MHSKISKYYNDYILDFNDHIGNVYHYTSFNGFKSIIENGKLRFTNRFFLNDYSEGKYILDLCINSADTLLEQNESFKKCFVEKCKDKLEKIESDSFQFYQCSFTTDWDNLAMWNYYSGDGGVNIKFNTSKLRNCFSAKVNGSKILFSSGHVIYDQDKQLDKIKQIIRDFLDNNTAEKDYVIADCLVSKLVYAGIFFKPKEYKIEKEYRMAFELFSDDGRFNSLITSSSTDYKINIAFSHNMVVPFLDIKFDKSAICGLTVPALVTQKEQDAIKLFAKSNGCKLETIKKSEISKRF